ncbi:hypothetical protein Tco_0559364 [Tanacetum coccineum]
MLLISRVFFFDLVAFLASLIENPSLGYCEGGGVKEKDQNNENNKAVKDGVVPSITIDFGNAREENVGQSSTGPTASESRPDVSFASLLKGESKCKGLNFRTLITQAEKGADVSVPLESIRVVSESFMDGLDSMLKNVWVKLHGVHVTAFTKDGLSVIATDIGIPLMLDSYTSDMCIQSWGRSSYARALIEIRSDVKLKDTIVVAMPKLTGREECPKSPGLSVAKNLKKPSQASRGVSVGPKKDVEPTKEVSNSNPFYVLNSVVNDEELGTNGEASNLASKGSNSSGSSFWNVETSSISTAPVMEKIGKLEQLIIDGKGTLVDDDGKPLKRVDFPVDHDSDDEVYSVDNDMARSMVTETIGFGTQSQDLPDKLQDICDSLDIRVRGCRKK